MTSTCLINVSIPLFILDVSYAKSPRHHLVVILMQKGTTTTSRNENFIHICSTAQLARIPSPPDSSSTLLINTSSFSLEVVKASGVSISLLCGVTLTFLSSFIVPSSSTLASDLCAWDVLLCTGYPNTKSNPAKGFCDRQFHSGFLIHKFNGRLSDSRSKGRFRHPDRPLFIAT